MGFVSQWMLGVSSTIFPKYLSSFMVNASLSDVTQIFISWHPLMGLLCMFIIDQRTLQQSLCELPVIYIPDCPSCYSESTIHFHQSVDICLQEQQNIFWKTYTFCGYMPLLMIVNIRQRQLANPPQLNYWNFEVVLIKIAIHISSWVYVF